ncbi:HTTM domain-containing protein [Subtercola boreus]|uniref:HTTM-like domain-containing protein n=1 Tax=Subtercola boreus TaxID=120213 RepID=A0A3E0W936_9MICO|nr:HTTM domain-containing protein [Subtercola boreus]RFA18976.1 hypothetical protein B7R23_13305 [Subtercola boreus]RFA19102.1 hypothetical protein B7R24_13315 [Subtercola boreus]RFA25702.1 hypothetical protein B7R25_13415 [Subtercola boreus]
MTLVGSTVTAVGALYRRGEEWMLGQKHATYGVSAARVVYGAVVVGFVAANFGVRDFLWGPGSSWVSPIEHQTAWPFPFVFFSSADPEWLFTLKFLLLGLAGLALMLGWHSRISAIVTLFLYISLVSTNPVAYDQTDNAFRILLFYFCFTDLSGHWSLDARRRSRAASGPRSGSGSGRRLSAPRRRIPSWVTVVLHNGGVIAVALQLFIIYGIAGLAKVAGSQWADGTAVYYPLQLDSLNPWPWLAQLVTANALAVNVATYVSVYVEVFFAFLLLTRWTRILALIGIAGMHLGIAVLMGLPFFSFSMMAADGIFIRDVTWQRAETWVRRKAVPLVARLRRNDLARHV